MKNVKHINEMHKASPFCKKGLALLNEIVDYDFWHLPCETEVSHAF